MKWVDEMEQGGSSAKAGMFVLAVYWENSQWYSSVHFGSRPIGEPQGPYQSIEVAKREIKKAVTNLVNQAKGDLLGKDDDNA